MFTFKFIRGTTRFVIVVSNEFVIKIANPFGIITRFAWSNFSYALKRRKWSMLGWELWRFVLVLIKSYKLSLQANLVEGWCSFRLGRKLTFLTPTFTFGLCNIQPYVRGSTPSNIEVCEFMDKISSPYGDNDFMCIDPHEFDPNNWKITPNGMVLIDYGGVSDKFYTLPGLFFKYETQITERLAAQ